MYIFIDIEEKLIVRGQNNPKPDGPSSSLDQRAYKGSNPEATITT
jgi:hypothetical protein